MGNDLKSALPKEKGLLLISLKRKNSQFQFEKLLLNVLAKMRRLVEASFFQLSDQFNMNKVLAKSKWELMIIIALKILAHTLSFMINIIIGNIIDVGQIKHLVFG